MEHALILILVTAAVTYFLRAFPFIMFGRKKEAPEIILYLGKVLPPAIMVILVIYCIKGISLIKYPFGLPELISVAVVALLHIWKKNTLLSIGAGTVCYMLLIQLVF